METKTSVLENQITLLASKMESLQFHILANKSSPTQPTNQPENKENAPVFHFLCDVCDCEYISKDDLKNHMTEHLPIISCKKCNYQTTSNEDLKHHRQNEHKPVILKCTECDFQSVHSNQLEKHKKTVHIKPEPSCNSCTYVPTDEADLKRHDWHMHKGSFSGENCNIKCTNKNDFTKHVFQMHGKHQSTTYFASRS